MEADPDGVLGAEDGHTHEADEQVQAGAGVVVRVHPLVQHRPHPVRLHVLQRAAAAALVGRPPLLRHRLLLHPPHQHHRRHHQPGAGFEHHHRVHHRVHVPGPPRRQHPLQDLRLHQHVPGPHLPPRLQARPLHEDTPQVHVHRSARRDRRRRGRQPHRRLVDVGEHRQHLRCGWAAPGQPLDLPQVPGHLRRLGDMGAHRPRPALRPRRAVQEPGVAVPGGGSAAGAGVGVEQVVPGAEVDTPGQHPGHLLRVRGDAAGYAHQHRDLAGHRHRVQLLRLPVPEGVVAEVQLRAVGGARCGDGLHGCAPVLRPAEREPEPELVGDQARPLPSGHLPHGAGDQCPRMPDVLGCPAEVGRGGAGAPEMETAAAEGKMAAFCFCFFF
uniref:Uncharacterized protein n=1 Tax=Anthurium amnicola TaxID=1678845 RepID=A0A1D1ZJZ4_9ARAE